MDLTKDDWFWLAGLLEGEGSFCAPVPSAPNRPIIALEMCDRDVVERAARLMGIGSIYTQRRGLVRGHRCSHQVHLRGAAAAELMLDLDPLLGERRRAQILRALEHYRPRRAPRPSLWGEPLISDPSLGREWLAGLLEGEGCFYAGPPSSRSQMGVSVQMCDRDVIERAARLMGARYIYERRAGADRGWRPTHTATVVGYRATTLMRELRPLMGARRKEQIDRALASYSFDYVRVRGPDLRCRSEGCTRPHDSRGLCHTHYMRWFRHEGRSATKEARRSRAPSSGGAPPPASSPPRIPPPPRAARPYVRAAGGARPARSPRAERGRTRARAAAGAAA